MPQPLSGLSLDHKARNIAQRVLQDRESFAFTLVTLLIDRLGSKALFGGPSEDDPKLYEEPWAPETLRLEVFREFGAVLPDVNLDKIMAGASLVTSDDFYRNCDRFIRICNILSGDSFDPTIWDPADADEMAWGITEAVLFNPPEDDEPFSAEIRHYIGRVLDQEGIVDPPDVLRLALRDSQPDVQADSDHEAWSAFHANQAARSQEILDMLRENLTELFNQLRSLPLENGNVSAALKKVKLLDEQAEDEQEGVHRGGGADAGGLDQPRFQSGRRQTGAVVRP